MRAALRSPYDAEVVRVRVFLAVLTLGAVTPLHAAAQDVDTGVTAIGLIAIQPPNREFNSPYLDGDLGWVGPGFALDLNVVAPRGFVASGEFTTAHFEGDVSGRLISGNVADQGRARRGRLNDALLMGFVGYAKTSGKTRILFVVGPGWARNGMTLDDAAAPASWRTAFGGGVDVLRKLRGRADLAVSTRYALVDRDSAFMSNHVVRGGLGVRVRLN